MCEGGGVVCEVCEDGDGRVGCCECELCCGGVDESEEGVDVGEDEVEGGGFAVRCPDGCECVGTRLREGGEGHGESLDDVITRIALSRPPCSRSRWSASDSGHRPSFQGPSTSTIGTGDSHPLSAAPQPSFLGLIQRRPLTPQQRSPPSKPAPTLTQATSHTNSLSSKPLMPPAQNTVTTLSSTAGSTPQNTYVRHPHCTPYSPLRRTPRPPSSAQTTHSRYI